MRGVTEHQVRNRFKIEPLAMGRPSVFWNRSAWLIGFDSGDRAVLVHSKTLLPKTFTEVGSAAKRLFIVLGCQIPVTIDVVPEWDVDVTPLPLLYQI